MSVREMSVRAMALASIAVLMCMALGCPPRKPKPIIGHSGTPIMKTVETDVIVNLPPE